MKKVKNHEIAQLDQEYLIDFELKSTSKLSLDSVEPSTSFEKTSSFIDMTSRLQPK